MYDVAIVGAGPAGLAASISLACEGRSVVVLEKDYSVGGQIGCSHLVENVVGYSRGFSGVQFAEESYNQALSLGVNIMLGQQVMMLYPSPTGLGFTLVTPDASLHSRAVLITVGVAPKPVPFEVCGSDCKVVSDPYLQPAPAGEHVIVYGGGNSAGQAACYYAKLGCKVTILSRRPLPETMDYRWITSLIGLGVDCIVGEIEHVQNDTVVFQSNGQVQHLIPHTLHSFLGGEPVTSWLVGVVKVDVGGYILVDENHCTATSGLFAAGDCVAGSVKRFTCAIGGGVEAVHAIHQYLTGLGCNPLPY